MTLRDAMPMAAARYDPYAKLLAQGYNLNRPENQEAITPDAINPYILQEPQRDVSNEIAIPWSAVCAKMQACGFQS